MNNVSHPADPENPTDTSIVTRHSVGIGTPAIPEYSIPETHLNAFEVMANGEVYILGVGGYDGTNAGTSGIKSIQEALRDIEHIAINPALYGKS